MDGSTVGADEGSLMGITVGDAVGLRVGFIVGDDVGAIKLKSILKWTTRDGNSSHDFAIDPILSISRQQTWSHLITDFVTCT